MLGDVGCTTYVSNQDQMSIPRRHNHTGLPVGTGGDNLAKGSASRARLRFGAPFGSRG